MPNWCINECRIVGPIDEIAKLYNDLNKWTEHNLAPNGFGSKWLGNIVIGAKLDWQKYNCRGRLISEISRDETGVMLSFSTETAWSDIKDTWNKILEVCAPNCKYYYFSEESGMGYVGTNDIDKQFWNIDYVTDIYIDNPDENPYPFLEQYIGITGWTIKSIVPFLQKVLDIQTNDITTLLEQLEKNKGWGIYGEDNGISVFEVMYEQ